MDRSQHTCYKDDGGTPNRRCYACEDENNMPMVPVCKICGIDAGRQRLYGSEATAYLCGPCLKDVTIP